MGILEAVIYGIIQGVAEFLPISSSGHLALAHNFFGTNTENALAFDIMLHLATLVSVCVVFRKDIAALFSGFFSLLRKLFTGRLRAEGLSAKERLFLYVCVATLPLIPVKLLGLDDSVEAISRMSWLIGVLLIINGLMLFASDRVSRGGSTPENGGWLRALGVGIVQAVFGILPGISRSGSTITGGRSCMHPWPSARSPRRWSGSLQSSFCSIFRQIKGSPSLRCIARWSAPPLSSQI